VFETVDHTGDVAIRIRAASFTDLVAEGIRAIASVLFQGEPLAFGASEHWQGRIAGVDREDTLVRALSEALHWMQDAQRVPLRVEARELEEDAVGLELEGVRADGERCRQIEEIKAVTYHNLEIRETPQGLETIVVLDV
jgi:SHS2 domain-containing protein